MNRIYGGIGLVGFGIYSIFYSPIKAYKGFDDDLKCRGFQFEIGKSYSQKGKIKLCEHGFHCCIKPIDVNQHYFVSHRHAIVFASGNISNYCPGEKKRDKFACGEIEIHKELSQGEWNDICKDTIYNEYFRGNLQFVKVFARSLIEIPFSRKDKWN